MYYLPKIVMLSSGIGFGSTEISAFDDALFSAGVADYNLVRVSSIVPARATVIDSQKEFLANFEKGSILPVVYTNQFSHNKNISIASGLVCGTNNILDENGVIFEYSGEIGEKESEIVLNTMLDEAAKRRKTSFENRKFIFSHTHCPKTIACTLAIAILLDNI